MHILVIILLFTVSGITGQATSYFEEEELQSTCQPLYMVYKEDHILTDRSFLELANFDYSRKIALCELDNLRQENAIKLQDIFSVSDITFSVIEDQSTVHYESWMHTDLNIHDSFTMKRKESSACLELSEIAAFLKECYKDNVSHSFQHICNKENDMNLLRLTLTDHFVKWPHKYSDLPESEKYTYFDIKLTVHIDYHIAP
ncbi:MAG: hypothetical protein NTX76_02370 [Alphaproteobacteria bacterium]|nr:hypothetical protein [Alphaproteobacteria bacterium]